MRYYNVCKDGSDLMEQVFENSFQKILYFFHFIARAFLIAILCMMLLIVLIFFLYLGDILITGGSATPLFSTYIVVSESMVPTIDVNDAIVVKRENDRNYNIGDIITFNSSIENYEGEAVTHRIVNKESATSDSSIYTTKGDNNSRIDPATVRTESIYGKVLFKIPNLGTIQSFFAKPSNFFISLIIPAMIVILYDIGRILFIMNRRRES